MILLRWVQLAPGQALHVAAWVAPLRYRVYCSHLGEIHERYVDGRPVLTEHPSYGTRPARSVAAFGHLDRFNLAPEGPWCRACVRRLDGEARDLRNLLDRLTNPRTET